MAARVVSGLRPKIGWIGVGLCAILGAFIAGTAPAVDLPDRDLLRCEVVGGVLILCGLVLAKFQTPRPSRRSLLIAPALVIVALGVLGTTTQTAAQTFLGGLTLCVVYLAMTQRPGITFKVLPFLLVDWWVAYPNHPSGLIARLPLAIVVWVLVGEIIARGLREMTEEATVLRSSALTDPLTQLPNRRRLSQSLVDLPEGGLVMFLDLDHFKAFNDRYGHSAGDGVLTQFADVLRGGLRSNDLVVRFGGEEFVIVLPRNTSSTDVYERLRDAWSVAGGPVTFSAGVAQRVKTESPDATMRRADEALYRAKASGRDQLVFDVACVPWTEASLESAPAVQEIAGDVGFTVQHVLGRLRGAASGRSMRETSTGDPATGERAQESS
jgi:diguanylate cyclase (GGDEF)-like protein